MYASTGSLGNGGSQRYFPGGLFPRPPPDGFGVVLGAFGGRPPPPVPPPLPPPLVLPLLPLPIACSFANADVIAGQPTLGAAEERGEATAA
jgi:hypothetical protein